MLSKTVCGNILIEVDDVWDDRNNLNHDECSSGYNIEDRYACGGFIRYISRCRYIIKVVMNRVSEVGCSRLCRLSIDVFLELEINTWVRYIMENSVNRLIYHLDLLQIIKIQNI